ncbi:hypothetical protein DCAR_0934706 [Daucus carota subsp. sativus]|uniref:rRNA N-glycosylase n=1 Tax=Daucus carota subsp. sativus TaxID=79200 RepID=A0A175YFU1_DAUCS|nr:hypothetical protein DCAR_0934706 [Daucus carota subsp. sativus]
MIYRGHDLYTVGHLDRYRHAFLLVQERKSQLRWTIKCLRHYGIRHTMMHAIGDSYPALEAVAQIRRAELSIGQQGFLTALNHLLVENPLANIRNTGFSYLFLCVFVCEGRRIVLVRDSIVHNFTGLGLPVPEYLLQYVYGWAGASFILEAFATAN